MIRRLAPDIAARIAAGEAIERPASVAKELVENSLDAGASVVSIRTEQGGKSSLVVEDDGCGIEFDELPLALERYATSKISDIEDLERISTLGYRGEALASVAAVSRMEIRSRATGREEGGVIRCEGGKITLCAKAPAKPGTRIQIDDLFFNLPARRKFLKTAQGELRRIVQIINDYALARPEITFRLCENNKKILNRESCASVDEALSRRWGAQTEIYKTRAQNGAMTARLWWNPLPDSRRVVVTLFVNGRRVKDAAVRAAVLSGDAAAYGEWLVMMDLPPCEADVNIHPTKEEIRFRKSGDVFKIIKDGAAALFAKRHSAAGRAARASFDVGDFTQESASEELTRGESASCESSFSRAWEFNKKTPFRAASPLAASAQNIFIPAAEDDREEDFAGGKHYIGQSAEGFLLFDFPDALAVMDPHAAHERILFEEICESFKGNIAVQSLTLPMEIPEAALPMALIHEKELASLGFSIKDGRVTAVPAIRGKGHMSAVDMLRSALRGIESESDPAKRDREVWWRMARLACRDAVKLGRRFEPEEAEELLSRLERCETPYTCPHGRPTVFLIENRRLRERFER